MKLVGGIIRDLFSDKVDAITLDNKEILNEVKQYLKNVDPDLLERVHFHDGPIPLFDKHKIEDEIQKSRDRGYTLFLNMLVDRMGAVGVPVIGAEGKPIAALAIAALSDRISSRLELMVEALKREADIVADVKTR